MDEPGKRSSNETNNNKIQGERPPMARQVLKRRNSENIREGGESYRGDGVQDSTKLQIDIKKQRTELLHDEQSLPSPVRTDEKDGWRRIGKVLFNVNDKLGYGCMGTIVYRGKLEKHREVAVKRVNIDFYDPTDREDALLGAADSHQNVIRYFHMDEDINFRYLILELCVASLHDYVEEGEALRETLNISPKEILLQSTDGLAHLHSIQIVHRDLKPRNVLFSTNLTGKVTMKISDFGISKKIHPGSDSLSMSSRMAGTDGWIAPEELWGEKTSYSMDVFSLGCIFYYVLTDGSHPFGEFFHRTSNIVNGVFCLGGLSSKEHCLSFDLIYRAIAYNPSYRPSAKAILAHPIFWKSKQILDFLCDVSDRVIDEKDGQSDILLILECDADNVFTGSWADHLEDEVKKLLNKYDVTKIQHLTRLIRNLRHHTKKQPPDVRALLGETQDEFAAYFISRFPVLLHHVYVAMEFCSDEPMFSEHYTNEVRIWMKEVRQQMTEDAEKAAKSKMMPVTAYFGAMPSSVTGGRLFNMAALYYEVAEKDCPCCQSRREKKKRRKEKRTRSGCRKYKLQ